MGESCGGDSDAAVNAASAVDAPAADTAAARWGFDRKANVPIATNPTSSRVTRAAFTE
jgi:hypothetical protein